MIEDGRPYRDAAVELWFAGNPVYSGDQLNARGSVGRDVEFMGATYPAGTPLLAVYRFDSYRLTYRYSISVE